MPALAELRQTGRYKINVPEQMAADLISTVPRFDNRSDAATACVEASLQMFYTSEREARDLGAWGGSKR